MRHAPLVAFVAVLLSVAPSSASLVLFNGTDLTGFNVHGTVLWVIEGGVLKNTAPADAFSFLQHEMVLPGSDFVLEARVKIVNGMRFRLHTAFDQLYVGNEGYWRQFEPYGNRVYNVSEVSNDLYVTGQWYDLRLEVDAVGGLKLFKDGALTHTANVVPLSDIQVTLLAGDGWSPGMIELERLVYSHGIPEPPAAAVWLTGGCFLAMCGLWRRRRRVT